MTKVDDESKLIQVRLISNFSYELNWLKLILKSGADKLVRKL